MYVPKREKNVPSKRVSVCVCVRACVRVYVCMPGMHVIIVMFSFMQENCERMCMYVNMYVCVFKYELYVMCACIHTHIYVRYTCVHTNAHAYQHMHTYTHKSV